MLKVGDRVQIRADLEPGTYYGHDEFVRDMSVYIGQTATIVRAHIDKDLSYFSLDIVKGPWVWTEEMFEPVAMVTPEKFYREIMEKYNV